MNDAHVIISRRFNFAFFVRNVRAVPFKRVAVRGTVTDGFLSGPMRACIIYAFKEQVTKVQVHYYLTKTQMSLKREMIQFSVAHVTASGPRDWRISSVPCAPSVRLSDYKMPSESKPLLTAQTEKPNHYS